LLFLILAALLVLASFADFFAVEFAPDREVNFV